jgi:ADP-ribose pyrophosphatase YjhB (NUDIX family)
MEVNEALVLLEQILKTALTGRNYAKNHFDRERFEALHRNAADLYQCLSRAKQPFLEELAAEGGYLTPKVGVNALIRDASGRMLLEKRSDDHTWGLPGGWAETGLSPEANVAREVREETGLEVAVTGLLGVFTRLPGTASIHTSYHLLYSCLVTGGELILSPESDELTWKTMGEVDEWHKDHGTWLRAVWEKISLSDK